MPLKFVLRPNEKVIINGAVVGVGDRPGVLFLYNTANFLRGREILKEEQIDSIEKKLYFVIQLIYIFPEDTAVNLVRLRTIITEMRESNPEYEVDLSEIEHLIDNKNYYRALKICRKLFKSDHIGSSSSFEEAS
ncbi:flagellar protein FlbT [Azospirillaceae bacterium]